MRFLFFRGRYQIASQLGQSYHTRKSFLANQLDQGQLSPQLATQSAIEEVGRERDRQVPSFLVPSGKTNVQFQEAPSSQLASQSFPKWAFPEKKTGGWDTEFPSRVVLKKQCGNSRGQYYPPKKKWNFKGCSRQKSSMWNFHWSCFSWVLTLQLGNSNGVTQFCRISKSGVKPNYMIHYDTSY